MKKSIIQALVLQNPSSTVHKDLCCCDDKVDDTCPASNHVSDIPKMKIKTKILKDKDTNDADIKDGEGCLDKKNIAIMKKKRK